MTLSATRRLGSGGRSSNGTPPPSSGSAVDEEAAVAANDPWPALPEWLVDDNGGTSVRHVELGVTDAFWIEITGGLEHGERVLEFPTQYDFGPGSR